MPFTVEGYEKIAKTVLTTATATTGAISFAARDQLLVQVTVTGYGGSDIASLRFNADTGTNYGSRSISFATGGVSATDAPFASASLARLHPTAVATGRSSLHAITNRLASNKIGTISAQTGSANAATVPVIEFGGFQWFNTTAQITSIELLTAGGATLSAGSGFTVFGTNLS